MAEAYPPSCYALVSLLDLLRFAAKDWNQIIRDMDSLSSLVGKVVYDVALGHRDEVTQPLERIVALCKKLGLDLSAVYAARLVAVVTTTPSLTEHLGGASGGREPLKAEDFVRHVSVLRERIDDELGGREFFALAAERTEYFETPNLFGTEVATAFPATTVDIEEAGKCFALGRYTACVFHLMRVVEHGLHALADYLSVPHDFKTWDPIIKKMRTEVDDYSASSFKGNLDFIRQTLERLTGVQLALRNEIMHAKSFYDEERADDIYRATRTFMQLLSTQLKATP